MDNKTIGKNIAKLRKEKNLTQEELGQRLFVTDKAVSKWERGLSLPDITLLENLANELDTDIYTILQIKKKKDIDIKKILEAEKIKIKNEMNKRNKILIIISLCIITFILFKLLPIGYNVIHTRYDFNGQNKLINLGAPKFSFYLENKDNNYSMKNLRGNYILKSEVKTYLSTLKQISCYDTIYYYDKNTDITITDYSIKNRFFYNNISYNIRNGNYCNQLEIKEYEEKLGGILKYHTYQNETFRIEFLDNSKLVQDKPNWQAELYVYNGKEILEKSTGTFKIENDELIYFRKEIISQKNTLKIPNESHFVIRNTKMILKDNYLDEYKKGIILE